MRDSNSEQIHKRTEEIIRDHSNISRRSIDQMMDLQIKQMEYMKMLTEQFKSSENDDQYDQIEKETHTSTCGQKRSRPHDEDYM